MEWQMLGTLVAAVALGELLQWAAWMKGHPERSRLGYWGESLPHFMTNGVVVIVVAVAWLSGMLTKGLEKVGASDLTQFVSETKPFGFMLMLFSDIYGDRLAFAFRGVAEKRLGFLLPKPAEPPAPQPPEESIP